MENIRKYVSMFRIDGVPILPSLMTAEKRRQMQKLKEKAIKIERKLEANRRKKSSSLCGGGIDLAEDLSTVVEQETESQNESSSSGGLSHSTSEYDEIMAKEELQNSYLFLTDMIGKKGMTSVDNAENVEDKISQKAYIDSSTNTSILPVNKPLERNVTERMQKLQLSETLIYDNGSNSIIMPTLSELQEQQILHRKLLLSNVYDKIECADTSDLSLEVTGKQIPSICVNPPTPLTGSHTFCDSLSATESVRSIEISDMKTEGSKLHDKVTFSEDPSSDESWKGSQSSLHDKYNLKVKKIPTNITAKILQFEERIDKNALGMQPPQRSATSPSLKAVTMPTPANNLNVSNNSQSENPLVRSNSFTLDCPSKALLEHIKQQTKERPTAFARCGRSGGIGGSVAIKRMSPSARAIRDTVESKAKRVQKVEHKPPRLLPRQSARSSSNSNNSPYVFSNNINSNNLKNKRSPYDLKSATKIKTTTTRQVKKSTSMLRTTTALKQLKSKTSMPLINANVSNPIKDSTAMSADDLSEIEAQHHQKFLKLLQQQQEEQKRLQIAFEAQQKILLEQFSNEMSKIPVLPSSALSTPSSSSCKTPPTITTPTERVSMQNSSNARFKYDFSELTLKSPNAATSANSTARSLITTDAFDDASTCSNITISGASLHRNVGSSSTTPRRRLFGREYASPSSLVTITTTANDRSNVTIAENYVANSPTATATAASSVDTSSSANRRQQHQLENVRRMEAATIINAYARGFLVRRLFQTEQIQRIVQTIRDTLIFVLNLHLETIENSEEANTPTNIKLKARLLQQLSSASRTLHLVFFQTTIKERMEIISRDRKRMRTKLLTVSMKRSPAIVR